MKGKVEYQNLWQEVDISEWTEFVESLELTF